MANNEWSVDDLRHKAQVYCAHTEHCESEVRDKLRQWGCAESLMDEIVTQLKRDNYINSRRYIDAFVHDKLLFQGWGRYKIQVMLRAKNEPDELIQQSLNNIDEDEYIRILRQVIQKKKGATREQVARFCLQRGFLWEEILPELG